MTALPTAEDVLPDRQQAILSPEPFELSKFDFRDADGALKEARSAVAARKDEAAPKVLEVIGELERHVRALRELAEAYGSDYDLLRDAAQQIVNAVQLEARDVVVGLGSSVLSAELSRSAYVSLDAGIAYPWRLENMVFYAGTNIYFRPVNKKAPLGRSFLSRVALTIGVTTTVHDASRGTEDLRTTTGTNPTTNSLLLGGGIRVTPSLRLSGGALIFKAEETNPLITQTSVKATPYAGFSIDVNLGALLKGFFPGP